MNNDRNSSRSGNKGLINEQPWGLIYSNDLIYAALIGFVVGAVLLGYSGWAFANGIWGITGLGQFAASGEGVSGFVGAGIGGVSGALAGAVLVLVQLNRRNRRETKKV